MKDWEIYENQIFGKLKKEFPKAKILKNQKINGIFSKGKRQIDILVKSEAIGKDIIVVIDCKKFSTKIDIKEVESFIGFSEDIGANLGIMITNIGYSKGAKNRISNYRRDIRLDIISFDKLEDYHFHWDTCNFCRDEETSQGDIFWDTQETLTSNGTDVIIEKGACSRCGESFIKCHDCGEIIHIDNDMDERECYCGNVFSVEFEYIGQGMTEDRVILKSSTK